MNLPGPPFDLDQDPGFPDHGYNAMPDFGPSDYVGPNQEGDPGFDPCDGYGYGDVVSERRAPAAPRAPLPPPTPEEALKR